MPKLSKKEYAVMIHALGGSIKKSFRNYFVASEGSEDDKIWKDLVRKELAVGREYNLAYDMNIYKVSELGLALLRNSEIES